MRITGSEELRLAPERAFEALVDPERLAACMPGCERLAAISPTLYELELSVPIPAVAGRYSGTIEFRERQPPTRLRIAIDATGQNGFVRADATLRLEANGDATVIAYEADAELGGMPAAAGQRVLAGITRRQVRQMLRCMEAGRPVGLWARLRRLLERLFGRRRAEG